MGEVTPALNPPSPPSGMGCREGWRRNGGCWRGANPGGASPPWVGEGEGEGGGWLHGGGAGVRGVTVSASFHRRHDEPCVDVGARLLTCSPLLLLSHLHSVAAHDLSQSPPSLDASSLLFYSSVVTISSLFFFTPNPTSSGRSLILIDCPISLSHSFSLFSLVTSCHCALPPLPYLFLFFLFQVGQMFTFSSTPAL